MLNSIMREIYRGKLEYYITFPVIMTSEKVGLQLNIQKTKIMASGPITAWQIDGETMETVADMID